jgi:hypothetical protein
VRYFPRFNSVRYLALTSLLALSTATCAQADTITADFAGVSPGETVSVNLGGLDFRNINAGFFNWTNVTPPTSFLAPSFQSFCAELNVGVQPTTTFTITPLQPRYSDTVASRLREFWGENFAGIGADATRAAAFQLGIWEIVHEDGNALDLSSGNFQATASPNGNAAINLAQSWLNNVNGQGTFADNLLLLDADGSQDQIVQPPVVPVPPSVILGGIGLIGLVGYGIRRKVSNNAVAP